MPLVSISPLAIYKSLNKSNCGECGVKTCLAFASLVSQGEKHITGCPYAPEVLIKELEGKIKTGKTLEEEQKQSISIMEKAASGTDFFTASKNLKCELKDHNLVIPVLGKNMIIAPDGHISSEIHVHSWIQVPLLNYVIKNSPAGLSGSWVNFKELPNGKGIYPLYVQRGEHPLRKIAEDDEKLFVNLIGLFGKLTSIEQIKSDFTFLLRFFPKFPILVCYSKPEDGFDSRLTLYYDSNSEEILDSGSIYTLAAGFTTMIEKFKITHG